MMTTGFENVVEADEVRLDVGIGIGDAVAHTGLSSEVHHNLWLVFVEDFVNGSLVSNIAFHKHPFVP